MNIKDYLNKIQKKESLFPIDSFPEKKEDKKKSVLRTFYPEDEDLCGEDIDSYNRKSKVNI